MPPSSSPYFNRNNSTNGQSISSRSNAKIKRNTSILKFFKKSETPPRPTKPTQHRITDYVVRKGGDLDNNPRKTASRCSADAFGGLFFEEGESYDKKNAANGRNRPTSPIRRDHTPDNFWEEQKEVNVSGDEQNMRFNEISGSVKRRRKNVEITTAENLEFKEVPLDNGSSHVSQVPPGEKDQLSISQTEVKGRIQRNGPFLDESDSEEDLAAICNGGAITPPLTVESPIPVAKLRRNSGPRNIAVNHEISNSAGFKNNNEAPDIYDGCLEQENEDDEGIYQNEEDFAFGNENNTINKDRISLSDDDFTTCPICRIGLGGLTDDEASLHVNNCLDTNSDTIPKDVRTETKPKAVLLSRTEQKAIARPGQKDPFTRSSETSNSSAFSMLMSGKAEDTAWTAAAANEVASRGKRSYERTCPFYKILPGFSICVDAFRYGAVEGCNAYFLSHFHSDHYIGLTSSWRHGPIYCSRVTGNLVRQQLKVDPDMIIDLEFEVPTDIPRTGGARVTMIPANHCPGSSLFLFEKTDGKGRNPKVQRILHCGDFRATPAHAKHPLLRPNALDTTTGESKQQRIDVCYLDTTYLNPKYGFPCQHDVITACAEICVRLDEGRSGNSNITKEPEGTRLISKFISDNTKLYADSAEAPAEAMRGRLLVVIGTYSIGKERICMGIARALKSKIYAPAAKQRICGCLEDAELSSLLTSDPLKAQVHMQSIRDMRAETLAEYLAPLKPRFTRVVGFRPTGWNYRPPASRITANPPVSTVLYSDSWKPRFTVKDLVAQRGSNKEASYFGVPYSEHSSFRELTMFCCALRISRVIPTVNVGSPRSREMMKTWVEKWEAEKRKAGLFKVEEDVTRW